MPEESAPPTQIAGEIPPRRFNVANDAPRIMVGNNRPYLVTSGIPVELKTPITSEHGEPLTCKK